MKKNEPSQEESPIIFKQNQFFSDETSQLLHDRILVFYPNLNEKEFNQIIKNLVDCLSSLILLFKIIPLTINQIGVESMIRGKQEVFYFQINNIKNDELSVSFSDDEHYIEFDKNRCFKIEQ